MRLKLLFAFLILILKPCKAISPQVALHYQEYTSFFSGLSASTKDRSTLAQKISEFKQNVADNELYALIERGLEKNALELAHGLARQLIKTHCWKLDAIDALTEPSLRVKNLIKKQYFLLTGDETAMKGTEGSPLTLTFREAVCSRKIFIENGRANFSNLFLESLEGFEMYAHPSLKELDLSYNCLKELPESLGAFVQVKVLLLNNNQLFSLPTSIGNLTNLIRLDLQHNNLENLPVEIGNLSSLWRMNLDANRLAELPECMIGLAALTWLSLKGNKLTVIPAWLKKLPSLQKISI